MVNTTHKIFTSFFVFLLFSDMMVSSLMPLPLTIAVAKKYVGNTVKVDGNAIVFTKILPTNRWPFFTLYSVNNVNKISRINELFLNYEGIFLKYLIDTFK